MVGAEFARIGLAAWNAEFLCKFPVLCGILDVDLQKSRPKPRSHQFAYNVPEN
jgi:hypothetical protein